MKETRKLQQGKKSLYINIPHYMTDFMELKKADKVEVEFKDNKIIITKHKEV